MDQLTFMILFLVAAGTTVATINGIFGEWEIAGAVFGLVVWSVVAQAAFAVEVYSGGTLAATKTYVSIAVLAAILSLTHLVITIETGSMMLRDRGMFFDA
jgi:hypothetical protein